jgi:peptidoglycan/LPS O-acetylase OafA/YrhL
MKYRPDIDGLRALAVLSVVGFHAFPGIFPGGFIGVDVFFVISGYLITGLIYEEIVAKSFSLMEFYARRIRRIFPALIFTILLTVILGLLIMQPEEYAQLGKHVVGGTLFYSNLLLWSEAGYFDVSAQVKPLLHLWSLGVEEQFYLIWPLALLAIFKKIHQGVRVVFIIFFISILSFIFNIIFISIDTVAAFYSPLTRFWELLVGSMLAIFERNDTSFHRFRKFQEKDWFLNAVSVLGVAIIFGALLMASPRYAFPGWLALAPTIGAALVIAAGPNATLNSWVFANRPAVYIGLISYPLYLLHWPLLSFVHIYEPEIYNPIEAFANTTRIRSLKFAALFTAFILSIFIYHLLERRIQKFACQPLAIKLSATILLLGLLGSVLYSSDGLAKFRGPIDGPVKSKLTQPAFLDCVELNGAIFNGAYSSIQTSCATHEATAKLDILIFGDSHGMDFYRGIEKSELSIGLFEANACMPLEGFEKDTKATCSQHLKLFNQLVESHKPKTIVVSLYFSRFYDWYAKKYNLNEMAKISFGRFATSSDLVLMVDVPILPFNPDNCRSRPIKRSIDCFMPMELYAQQRSTYEQGLRDSVRGIGNVSLVDPIKLFCSLEMCYGAKDGVLLYRDTHHLTNEGSNILGKWFLENYIENSKRTNQLDLIL